VVLAHEDALIGGCRSNADRPRDRLVEEPAAVLPAPVDERVVREAAGEGLVEGGRDLGGGVLARSRIGDDAPGHIGQEVEDGGDARSGQELQRAVGLGPGVREGRPDVEEEDGPLCSSAVRKPGRPCRPAPRPATVHAAPGTGSRWFHRRPAVAPPHPVAYEKPFNVAQLKRLRVVRCGDPPGCRPHPAV
jgi:hypothetical protein